jgi:hypothetical protein
MSAKPTGVAGSTVHEITLRPETSMRRVGPGAPPEIASLVQHFGGHRAVVRVIGGRRVDVVAPAAD